MRRAAGLLAALLAPLVVVAGCSGGTDGGSTTQSPDGPALTAAAGAAATPEGAPPRAAGAKAPILPCTGFDRPVPGAATATDGQRVGEGRPLPDLTLDCLGAGGPVTLRDLRGPMVLNLWASWCLPCRKELPFLTAAHEQFGDRVRFLGIAVSDFDAPATEWMSFHGVGWPSLADRKGSTRGPLRAPGPPVTLFVNSAGSVVGVHYGAFTSATAVEDAIAKHLGVS